MPMPDGFHSSLLTHMRELREDVRSLRDHVDSQIADLRKEHREDNAASQVALRDIDRKLDGGSDPERGVLARMQQNESDIEAIRESQQAAINAHKAIRRAKDRAIWAFAGAMLVAIGTYVGDRAAKAWFGEGGQQQQGASR